MTLAIKLPKFRRPTTFVALINDNEYTFYGGHLKILSSDGKSRVIEDTKFSKNIKEVEEPYRAAKSARLDGQPFMVGALARINVNHSYLNPLARGLFKKLNWRLPEYNTFYNIIAQAIEIVHCIEEAKSSLDYLIDNMYDEASIMDGLDLIAEANPQGQATSGCDAVEAPRGTLYHAYKVDRNGIIIDCQIVTPTNSFLKNLEEDLAAYLPNLKSLSNRQRSLKIRALIRAYDPCISCATH
jgi:coenzyme F420-reducing hydrogenase alpha subunit